jgi:photosystem II stability/assembly factor-like uncharacterized protein
MKILMKTIKAFLLSIPIIAFFFILIFFSEPEEILIEDHYVPGSKKALEFWTRSRAYPDNDIPAAKFFTSFEKAKFAKNSSKKNGLDQAYWEEMGPYNVPGRMISVAVNPQNTDILLAGSASGGLWRTDNSGTGEGWRRIHTGFPTLGVMAIAINPVDTNIIYIGTGEVYGYHKSSGGLVIRTTRGSYGIGILITDDGGKTWSKSLDWSLNQQRGIQCIRLNPKNPNSIYAATTEGIYKSTDAGENWNLSLPILMGEDIIIHPEDTSKVMVSCGNLGSEGSGLYISNDGGQNWDKDLNFPSFTGKTLLDFYVLQPNIIFASVADSLSGKGLYRSNSFGGTWSLVNTWNVASYQGFFAHWVAIHPQNLNEIIHAGVQIYKSSNAGVHNIPTLGPHVDHHNFARDPVDPDKIYIACDGGIYVSNNFGDSYESIGYGLQTAQFYNGFSSSHSDSMLAMGGLQDNGTQIYRGTKNWQWVIGGDGCWTAINPANDNLIYGEYQYNNIYRSEDRGYLFLSSTAGMDEPGAAFVAPFVLSPSHPAILYSGRKSVFKTTDNGDTWISASEPLDENAILSMAVSPTNSNIVFAGTAPVLNRAHIFRTLNGGFEWQDVTGNLPDRYPMDIAIDPNNTNSIYVVFGGFGSGHVYKSDDSGDTWTDMTGILPDVPTLAVVIDPLNSDHVYIGNDLGVYASTDAGESWFPFMNGLPEAVIAMDLNISPVNRKLRVATHGNGAYQSPLIQKFDGPFIQSTLTFDELTMVGRPISFTFKLKNWGNEIQQSPHEFILRILDQNNSETFTTTEYFCCLNTNEERNFTLDKSFLPEEAGDYTLQVIKLGSLENQLTDTTYFDLKVIPTTTISSTKVTKRHSKYREIKSIRKINRDLPTEVDIPFKFVFDGYEYDKALISYRGWVELGTGEDGTERGISTPTQLNPNYGYSEYGRITNPQRPTKVLAPWWGKLSFMHQGIIRWDVSYITEGLPPHRTFVVQWKDIYAAEEASTTLNFQLRLYETTNKIEFHYGPVTIGTYILNETMIGLEDHVGGEFHFYDIIGGGSLLGSEAVRDLDPITDWPGPDSMFVIYTRSFTDIEWENAPGIALRQNYPNPFNNITTIEFKLPAQIPIDLKIYNVLGQEIKTIVKTVENEGTYRYTWDGKNKLGVPVAAGMYILSLKTPEKSLIKKMIYLK